MAYLSSPFAISIDGWTPSEYGPIEERESIAELAIRLGDTYLTEVEDYRAASVRQTVRVSAFALAKWLLNGWWRLRNEPDVINGDRSLDWHLTHDISAIGNGFVWPPYTIVGEVDFYILKSLPMELEPPDLSPIRYLNPIHPTAVHADVFEAAVFDFAGSVISRLNSRGIQHSALHELYNAIRSEREEPNVSRLRQREALLGFDPDEAPDELFQLLDREAEKIGASAADEIAAAVLADSRDACLSTTFARLSDSIKNAPVFGSSKNNYRDIVRENRVEANSLVPTRQAHRGYEAARWFRVEFGLGSDPIDNDAFSEVFAVGPGVLAETVGDPPMTIGSRVNGGLAVALQPRSTVGRRFELGRVIGDDAFYKTSDTWRPVTKARTPRQQFQRAFAAELLCPIAGVRQFLDEGRSETINDDIAQHFNVSTMVVDYQLQNQSRIGGRRIAGPYR
jgi:hypothetical protein